MHTQCIKAVVMYSVHIFRYSYDLLPVCRDAPTSPTTMPVPNAAMPVI